MPTLYQLTDRYAELWRLADQCEDGEINTDLLAALNENEDDIRTKVDGYCKVISELKAVAASCKMEADRLSKRQKSLEATVDRIKANLKFGMEQLGETNIKTNLFSVRIQPCNPSVNVTDAELVPLRFQERQEPKILKQEILKELKAGNAVLGCELVSDKTAIFIR